MNRHSIIDELLGKLAYKSEGKNVLPYREALDIIRDMAVGRDVNSLIERLDRANCLCGNSQFECKAILENIIAELRASQSHKMELKPCPFCGGNAHVMEAITADTLYWIGCPGINCPANMHLARYISVSAASRVWNRRAS